MNVRGLDGVEATSRVISGGIHGWNGRRPVYLCRVRGLDW